MAPIISKPAPAPAPPERGAALALLARRLRPALQGLLALTAVSTRASVSAAGECLADVQWIIRQITAKVDRAFEACVMLLDGYCYIAIGRPSRRDKPRLQSAFPILFVLMMIAMLYCAFVFAYMPMAGIAANSRESLLFHAFIFLVLASHFQAARTDPGEIPESRAWTTFGQPPPEARERKRFSGEARWCRKTHTYKPDRAHYCSVMQRVVLRMDHHCPWLGNTVGFRNHKYFFLFLLYTNCACAQLGWSIVKLLVEATLPALHTFMLIGAEGLTLLLSGLLVPFFSFHCWLLVRNMTTIELCDKMRDKGDIEDPEASVAAPDDGLCSYDLGLLGNLCSVLGSNPFLWLLPFGGPTGDGTSFPVRAAGSGLEMVRDQPEEAVAASMVGAELGEQSDDEFLLAEKPPVGLSEQAPQESVIRNFLPWLLPTEFAEDLTIGCQVINSKVRDVFWYMASKRHASCATTATSPTLSSSSSVLKIRPAIGGGILSDTDSTSSASGSVDAVSLGSVFLSD